MLGRSGLILLVVILAPLAGCTAGGGMTRDSGTNRTDTGPDRMDSGPQTCTTAADCDDSIACTLDECVVGNVCRHDPLDARCNTAAGERCVAGRGCVSGMPTDCETHADCQDGLRCNGSEQCIAGNCFMATTPHDCNDGNACTEDICDESAPSGCRYETAPGCDAGTPSGDAGTPCGAFDAGTHYSGSFLMLPSQSCGGGGGSYSIDTLTFSASGGTLTVTAGSFTLTQSPAPTGPSFDVSGMNGCATVRITGTFSCADTFSASWSAFHSGGCAACGSTSSGITGVRR